MKPLAEPPAKKNSKPPNKPLSPIIREAKKKKKKKSREEVSLLSKSLVSSWSSSKSSPRSSPQNKITLPPCRHRSLIMDTPTSSSSSNRHSLDLDPPRTSMSFSPFMLRNWRRTSANNDRAIVYFPSTSSPRSTPNLRYVCVCMFN